MDGASVHYARSGRFKASAVLVFFFNSSHAIHRRAQGIDDTTAIARAYGNVRHRSSCTYDRAFNAGIVVAHRLGKPHSAHSLALEVKGQAQSSVCELQQLTGKSRFTAVDTGNAITKGDYRTNIHDVCGFFECY